MADDNDFNRQVIKEFRGNGGIVGGVFEGAPMMILTTTGARTGISREIPLVYTSDGGQVVIVASKGGAPTNPDWFHNLTVNPRVIVEVGTERYAANARVTAGEERDRLFNQMATERPDFATYQKNTERVIPVVVLERIA